MCVCVCVLTHLQEWERGEANGLANSAERQLPRERRPQGKSSLEEKSQNNRLQNAPVFYLLAGKVTLV